MKQSPEWIAKRVAARKGWRHTAASRRQMSQTRLRLFAEGKIVSWNKGTRGKQQAWNRGLTAADPRVAAYVKRGVDHPQHGHPRTAHEKAAMRRAMLKYWAVDRAQHIRSIRVACSKRGKLSLPERQFQALCQRNGWPFRYTGDGSLVIGRYNPDFHAPGCLVEVFGRYWHTEADIQPRQQAYTQAGYRVLFLWEGELDDTKELQQRVAQLLGTPCDNV